MQIRIARHVGSETTWSKGIMGTNIVPAPAVFQETIQDGGRSRESTCSKDFDLSFASSTRLSYNGRTQKWIICGGNCSPCRRIYEHYSEWSAIYQGKRRGLGIPNYVCSWQTDKICSYSWRNRHEKCDRTTTNARSTDKEDATSWQERKGWGSKREEILTCAGWVRIWQMQCRTRMLSEEAVWRVRILQVEEIYSIQNKSILISQKLWSRNNVLMI